MGIEMIIFVILWAIVIALAAAGIVGVIKHMKQLVKAAKTTQNQDLAKTGLKEEGPSKKVDIETPAAITTAQSAINWLVENSLTHSAKATHTGPFLVEGIMHHMMSFCDSYGDVHKTYYSNRKLPNQKFGVGLGNKVTVFRRKGQDGKVYEFAIQYEYTFYPVEAIKLKTESQDFDVEDFIVSVDANGNIGNEDGNQMVAVMSQIMIIYPTDLGSELKHSTLMDGCHRSRVSILPLSEERIIHIIEEDGLNGLVTHQRNLTEMVLEDDYLNQAYPSIGVAYKGTTKEFNGETATTLALMLLNGGRSVAIGATPGTGKTYFKDHIGATYASQRGRKVFIMDAETILRPHDWGSVFNSAEDNLVLIDQAENLLAGKGSARKFLDMVSGTFQRTHNVRFVIVYNNLADEKFDQAFLDPARGRFINFNVPELTIPQAKTLGHFLYHNNPETEFDKKNFEALLLQKDAMKLSQIYQFVLPKGAISLGQTIEFEVQVPKAPSVEQPTKKRRIPARKLKGPKA